MRALKEELVLSPCDEALGAHEYLHVIEKAMKDLNELERRAFFFRFWEPHTIAQVADKLRLEWEEADRLIDRTILKIQAVIKEHNARKIAA